MYRVFAGGPIGVSANYEESVELAAHHGFDGVVLNAGYAQQNGPETVVQMLEERNLKSGGWGLPVTLLGSDEDFEKQLEALPGVAEVCARTGDLRTSTWVSPASDEKPFDELFELLHGRVERVATVLKEYDVRLGLEFIGPKTSRDGKKHEFIHTMDGMLELCRAVGTGNVGLLLDAWHLYTSHGSNDDVLSLADDDVVNVHINDAPAGIEIDEQKDNVRCMPGETGVIGIPHFLANLKEIGYTGPVMVEPFSQRVRDMADEDAIRELKDCFNKVWPAE
jgi:sugar phosphate isomerase/epimerase